MDLGNIVTENEDLGSAYEALARNLSKRQYDAVLAQLKVVGNISELGDAVDAKALQTGIEALKDGR